VITAIRLDHVYAASARVSEGQILDGSEQRTTLDRAEAEAKGWFNGPPYAVAELVFDENDIGGCSKERE
jgi:hypothetical protein